MKPETFFDNFEVLADAPNGVQKLRELILQLAIQGKLVSHDLNGKTAKEILKEIEFDKNQLIQKRKLRLPKVTEKNEIKDLMFEIPENWCWYRLSEVAFFQEGPGIRNWQFKSQGVKLLNVQNILPNGSLFFDNSDKYVSEEEFDEKYEHFLIENGDLLFAASGGSWGKSAWFKNTGYKIMLNTSTMRLRFYSDKFEPNYLKYFLDSSFFKKQMELQLVGQQPNFGSTHLSRAYISIPPFEEQHRIVAKSGVRPSK